MKKIGFAVAGVLLLSSSLMADYELFVTYTKPLNSIKANKKTLLYTGDFKEYQEQFVELNEKYANGKAEYVASTAAVGATAGLAAGLGSAAAGMGIGLAAGLLTPAILDMQSDQLFIRVEKIEDKNGNFTLKRILMVGDKHPSYSVEQANAIMGGK